jgi:hypothetical protein
MTSCAHWPINVGPDGHDRGACDFGPEVAKQGRGGA